VLHPHVELLDLDAHVPASDENTPTADIKQTPAAPSGGARKEVEGEVGGPGDSRRGMGRLDRVEASCVEEAEKWRRVDGAVSAEERRVADEAAEGDARGGGADEIRGGRDAEEDLLEELADECRRRPLRLHGIEAGEDRVSTRRHGRRASHRRRKRGRESRIE